MDFTGLYYSEDIQFKETSGFDPSIFDSGVVFYEVLRIIDGTALFLEDHLKRLQNSVNIAGYSYDLSVPVVHYILRNLINRNNTANGNIRLQVHFASKPPVIYTFFVPHYYPGTGMYENGVTAALYKAERQDPNVKKVRAEMIRDINEFIKSKNIYDAVLVDRDGYVTEGSRTNVFFVQGNKLITAPSDRVLKGITRNKVFELCQHLNIQLKEDNILSSSLKEFDAAFFSGTSPKILPIRQIDEIQFNVENKLIKTLVQAYDKLILDYLNNN